MLEFLRAGGGSRKGQSHALRLRIASADLFPLPRDERSVPDFRLSALRDAESAKRLFRRALSHSSHPQPRESLTAIRAPIYSSAISDIKKEGTLRRCCGHRPVQYLNNILEQDHRAIKRRVKAKQGFREFQAARHIIQAYEAMHMIRKGQVRRVSGSDVRRQIQFIEKLFELGA